ncbi:carbohydrate ABC transporter permease [Halanaerocella petrolearia]
MDKIKNYMEKLFLAFWLLITSYPLIFMIQSSFKSKMEFITESVWSLPNSLSFKNYIQAIDSGFYIYFFNSLIVSFLALAFIILSASMASYVISRIDFKINGLVFILFVAGMMIPVHVTLIPIYKLTKFLGLYDQLVGLVGPYVAFSLPISIFILTGFMQDIPKELEEAAIIDGANKFQIFTKVILPLSKPAISTVAIYNLVMLWNEFVYALILLSDPEKWTLTLGLFNFQGQYGIDIPLVMTVLTLSILPLILLYIFFQERVIKGMTAGALKG